MEYRQSECQNSLNEIFELRLKALVCPLYKIGHKSLEVVLFLCSEWCEYSAKAA